MFRLRWTFFVLLLLFSKWTFAQNKEELPPFEAAHTELIKTWQVREHVHAMGTDSLGSKQLDRILQLKNELGLDSISEMSHLLIEEIKNETQEDASIIQSKIEYAQLLSPGAPEIALSYCKRPFGIDAISNCWKGFKENYATFDGKLTVMHNLGLTLLYSAIFCFVSFVCFACLYHLDSLGDVLFNFVPTLSKQSIYITISLATLVCYLLFGFLGSVGLLLFLIWHKLLTSQKIALFLSLSVISLSPFLLMGSALKLNYEQGIVPTIENSLSQLNIQENKKILSNWDKLNPQEILTKFNLARIALREQQYEEAKNLYLSVEAIKPGWNKVQHNLAIIYFRLGEFEKAENSFKELSASMNKSWKLFYNMGQIALSKTRLEEGRELLQKAKDLDPNAFSALRQSDQASKQVQLFDEALSKNDLMPYVWTRSSEVKAIQEDLHSVIFPNLPLPRFWVFLFILLIACIWTDLTPIRKMNADQSQSKKNKSFDVFDPSSTIVQSNTADAIRFQIKKFIEKWSGLLIPGTHFFIHDKGILAFLFGWIYFMCIYLLTSRSGWILPFASSIAPLCIFVLILIYTISILTTFMKET